jgi:hypothetical protein
LRPATRGACAADQLAVMDHLGIEGSSLTTSSRGRIPSIFPPPPKR